MINEGIFRSPKWLRNFLDFEVNTGDDIKGEPSKRAIVKEEKRKKEEDLKRWDAAWEKAKGERHFEQFLNGKLGKASYSTIWSSDYRDLKTRFRGDHNLFVQYNAYLNVKREEEKRQEDLRRELDNIIDSIAIDFNRAPYRDKIGGYRNNKGEFCVKYTFENGNIVDIFDMSGRRFKYSANGNINTYTTSIALFNKLVTVINEISNRMKSRPSYDKRSKDYYGSNSSTSKNRSNDSDPKRTRYKTLLDTIEHRKKQLSKMSKNDEGRAALENELIAAERMAKKMKDEYKFENLKRFDDFEKY